MTCKCLSDSNQVCYFSSWFLFEYKPSFDFDRIWKTRVLSFRSNGRVNVNNPASNKS